MKPGGEPRETSARRTDLMKPGKPREASGRVKPHSEPCEALGRGTDLTKPGGEPHEASGRWTDLMKPGLT